VLAHRRSGSGPPLILLHGIGLDRWCWEPVRPLLERERDVIAVDLPGFGESPAGTQTVPGLAGAVQALARDLGLDRFHAAGNSLGGGLALELGARGAASSVCAVSPVGFAAGRERAYAERTLATIRRLAEAVDPYAETVYGGPVRRALTMNLIVARPWRVPAHDAAHMNHATATAPGFAATLPEVGRWRPAMPACPTTIAWAQRDRLLIASRQAPRAARRLPAARHVRLEGCGHVPMWDDPAQVARVLLEASADA
jgi:pimeloyl-ACP methyl ester carboxylesterase